MEPEKNIQNNVPEEPKIEATVEEVAMVDEKPVANEIPKGDIVFNDKPKKNSGMILGMVLLAILAIGGIGFGVWTLLDGNAQKARLNEQIVDLNSQLAEKGQTTIDDTTVILDDNNYQNPVIKSNNAEEVFISGFDSSLYDEGGVQYRLSISVVDGAVSDCSIYTSSGNFSSDCVINGITGKIFKVVEFGRGHSNEGNGIGFIMTDGSVQYFPFFDAMENKDFSIKGNLNIDGIVVDAFGIGVKYTEFAGGHGTTVFVLHDGSIVEYDDSMLE